MPDNVNLEVALNYHNATKHSYASVRYNQHSLDFNNQPIPFKIYPDAGTVAPARRSPPDRSRRAFRHLRNRFAANRCRT